MRLLLIYLDDAPERIPTGVRRILHAFGVAFSALPVALWKGLVGRPGMVVLVAPALLLARRRAQECWDMETILARVRTEMETLSRAEGRERRAA